MRDQRLARLEALLGVGLRLAASAPTGRVALAQLAAAIEPEWIPSPAGDDFRDQLAAAADASSEPLRARDVERILRDAWGAKPTEELDELEAQPLAVTPGAQVHRGVLEGRAVAIKVLRPGLSSGVRQDLTLLETLAAPLGAAFPALDAGAILREVRERVLEELDLESEATFQRRFHRALREHPRLSVPAPVMRLCHEGVLVSELVEGTPFMQAPDPDRAAALLLEFTLGAARWGVAYADPAGENAILTPDGALAVVDFGACREVEAGRLARCTDVLEALRAEDEPGFDAALEALGWLPPEHAPAALALTRQVLAEHLGPGRSRLDTLALIAARRRLVDHAPALAELVPAGRLAAQDLWPARGVAGLFATIARLGAEGDWGALALEALRHGWN